MRQVELDEDRLPVADGAHQLAPDRLIAPCNVADDGRRPVGRDRYASAGRAGLGDEVLSWRASSARSSILIIRADVVPLQLTYE
jgi:hypothetical protein